ncbi:hypothetical protein JCM10450v2_000729 [Rhodotorula kratochvilovae]
MGGAHESADVDFTGDGFPDKVEPWNVPADAWEGTYKGSCHCGAVTFEAKGDPVASVCCHCTTCQVVHGATSQRAVLYKKDHIKFPKDVLGGVAFYQTHDKKVGRHLPCKVRCKTCGTLIADEGRNMWLAFPGLFKFPDAKEPPSFKTTSHIFYDERVFDIVKSDGVKFWSGKKDESEER